MSKLYDYPDYYTLAFSFRDILTEANTLSVAINRFSPVPVSRILEIGCGPAPHAGHLTGNGFTYTGLDINPNMLSHATRHWRQLNTAATFLQADMNDFSLPAPVDFAFVTLGSLYPDASGDYRPHFDCIARSLTNGGLYLLDSCVQFGDPVAHNGTRYIIENDGVHIESSFQIALADPTDHLYHEIWTVNVDDHGRRHSFRTEEYNRAWFPADFLRFIDRESDFEFVGWWRDWDLSQPLALDSS